MDMCMKVQWIQVSGRRGWERGTKVACAIAVILFLSVWPIVADDVRADEEPSLEETMKWMQSKVGVSFAQFCNVQPARVVCSQIALEAVPEITACAISYKSVREDTFYFGLQDGSFDVKKIMITETARRRSFTWTSSMQAPWLPRL